MFTCELCGISTNMFFKKYFLETASVFSTNYEELETPINTTGDYLHLLKIYGYWLLIPGYYSSFLHFIIQIHLMTGNVMDENQISTQIQTFTFWIGAALISASKYIPLWQTDWYWIEQVEVHFLLWMTFRYPAWTRHWAVPFL